MEIRAILVDIGTMAHLRFLCASLLAAAALPSGPAAAQVPSPADAARASEGASALTTPGRVVSERPERPGPQATDGEAAPSHFTPRLTQRRLVLRATWLSSFAATVATSALAIGTAVNHQRGCDNAITYGDCGATSRQKAVLTFALATPLIVPTSAWLAGRLRGGEGKLGLTVLSSVCFLLASALVASVTTGVAETNAGMGVGFGISAVLPAIGSSLGFLASDAEQRYY